MADLNVNDWGIDTGQKRKIGLSLNDLNGKDLTEQDPPDPEVPEQEADSGPQSDSEASEAGGGTQGGSRGSNGSGGDSEAIQSNLRIERMLAEINNKLGRMISGI